MTQSSNYINKIVTGTSTIWLGEDGILCLIHFPNAEVMLEDARETMAAYAKLCSDKRCPLFADITTVKSLSREARLLYSSEEAARIVSAVALLIGTPVSKVLGNFYLGLRNPHMPTRLFTSKDDALEWLKEYIE